MTKQKVYAISALAMVGLSFIAPLAHAQSLPTPGTSDIAEANGPVWTALFNIVKYYIATYGSLMLWLFGIIAVFVLGILLAKKFLHF